MAEHDALALRLRIEALEEELEDLRRRGAEARAELDRVRQSVAGRALSRLARAAAARERAADQKAVKRSHAPDLVRIPLVGMPVRAWGPSLRWADELSVGGTQLPGVQVDAPSGLTYRLLGGPSGRLQVFAGIRASTRDGNQGGVRFVVSVRDSGGVVQRRAERLLDPLRRPRDRAWTSIDLDLEGLASGEHELVLTAELPDGADPAFAWAMWGDPVLLVPAPSSLGPSVPEPPVAANGHPPVISFLVPVHDPAPAVLRSTIDSVFAQTSPNWQLCLADDGSRDPAVRAVLDEAAASDRRVLMRRTAEPRGISEATNSALAIAAGSFVAPLDHDDALAPETVAEVGARLASVPEIDVLYTDNDKQLPGGPRFAASLKPGWSPEFLRACMYTLHLGVYRRDLVERIGGFRPAYDGAQDHDLVLRLAEAGARVDHLPSVLHHWGVHASSTAQSADAKPHAFERGVAAVQDHLTRTGVAGKAVRLPFPGRYRVIHDADALLSADLIVPLPEGMPPGGSEAIEALAADGRAGVKVTVIGSTALEVPVGVAVHVAQGRGWGDLAAAGLAVTSAPVVVFFEDLCVPETEGWLDELAGFVREPAVGAAGALVVDDEQRVVHAGVALPAGVPLPVHPGAALDVDDPPPELTMVTNRSAAAGVVAVDRAALMDAGGIAAGDRLALTATTLALHDAGSRIVISPHARFRLSRPSRGSFLDTAGMAEIAARRAGRRDLHYNPQLWRDRASHTVPTALRRAGLAGGSGR